MQAAAFIMHMPRLAVRGMPAAGSVYVALLFAVIMSATRPMHVFCCFNLMLLVTARPVYMPLFVMFMPAAGPVYMPLIF
jgi:hypothetical protein